MPLVEHRGRAAHPAPPVRAGRIRGRGRRRLGAGRAGARARGASGTPDSSSAPTSTSTTARRWPNGHRWAQAPGCHRWSCRSRPWATSTRRDDPVAGAGGPVATEVFAFGRMPLAFSARCFTARHHRLKKDECDFRCRDDADGMLLAPAGRQAFQIVNDPDPVARCTSSSKKTRRWRRPRALAAAVAVQPRLRRRRSRPSTPCQLRRTGRRGSGVLRRRACGGAGRRLRLAAARYGGGGGMSSALRRRRPG